MKAFWLLLGSIMIAVGMACAPAASVLVQNNEAGFGPGRSVVDQVSGDGATIKTIAYWVYDGEGVHRHTINYPVTWPGVNTINVDQYSTVLFSVKAKCGGPSGSSGMLLLSDAAKTRYQGMPLTPGVWATMKVVKPFDFDTVGTSTLYFIDLNPSGSGAQAQLNIVVSA